MRHPSAVVGLFCLILLSFLWFLSFQQDPRHWVGEWEGREEQHLFIDYRLELMADGSFDTIEAPTAETCPRPVFYSAGTWSVSGQRILLRYKKAASRPPGSSLHSMRGLYTAPDGAQCLALGWKRIWIVLSHATGPHQERQDVLVLARRSETPKPTDWSKL
jgi:hypothetical protein